MTLVGSEGIADSRNKEIMEELEMTNEVKISEEVMELK